MGGKISRMFHSNEINQIKRNKSREYFKDILQSYYSKNYRATILLLHSLVIDDLYDKLIIINERRYFTNLNDKLNKIEELKNNERYSEIEEKIFKIYKENNILNHDTIDMLEYLKKVRNKCAHPTYFKEEDYIPLEEEVYMFIVKVYKDILIKETFIKDPYSIIKTDIEDEKWGGILEVIAGSSEYELDYARFKLHFTKKYLEKFTDYNFKKLFTDIMKVMIIKNGEWEKLNQYRNMMLMRCLLEYLNENGKMEILMNYYEWTRIQEEQLIDDDKEDRYDNEWFALTYLYNILTYNNFFINELKEQNELVYHQLKEKLFLKTRYVREYWHLFYNEEQEMYKDMEKQGIDVSKYKMK